MARVPYFLVGPGDGYGNVCSETCGNLGLSCFLDCYGFMVNLFSALCWPAERNLLILIDFSRMSRSPLSSKKKLIIFFRGHHDGIAGPQIRKMNDDQSILRILK